MEIKGKVHCFFEQSGTFKKAFRDRGLDAEDYDIENSFGETDHQLDLFAEIDKAWDGQESVFDSIGQDDLIMAFFPCIAFSCVAQMWYSLGQRDYRKWPKRRIFDYMLAKMEERNRLLKTLYKFCGICLCRGLRLVIENPWALNHYLKTNVFLQKPSVIDQDRSRRGDHRIKPTAYWFFNCQPTTGESFSDAVPHGDCLNHDKLPKNKTAGKCSIERSMISPAYAKNWINDFIFGQEIEAATTAPTDPAATPEPQAS